MPAVEDLGRAFPILAPVFQGTSRSLICGSSALAWMLSEIGIELVAGDIDAVALRDDEFELLVGRLGDLERAGGFHFDDACRHGWACVPGEEVRRAAGRLLLPGTSVAFELFDRRSRFIGSAVIGDAAAGIARLAVAPGIDLPFADIGILKRINDHVMAERRRDGDAADLRKRRRWDELLDRLANERGPRLI